MALPRELLQYAENLYRRFPEEFLALGAPGLEEVYDLRPNGTWSRCIQETTVEKIVEVKLQRWARPAPCLGSGLYDPMLHRFQQAQAPGYQALNQYAWQPQTAPQWEAPAGSHAEAPAHITSCLSRLEKALSVLAPQIEVLHARASQTQADPTSPGAGSSSDKNVHQTVSAEDIAGAASPQSDSKAMRGQANSLSTWAVQKVQAAEKVAEAAKQKPAAPSILKRTVDTKASLNINAVRVSPGIHDPQSPRSPGRYSAWK